VVILYFGYKSQIYQMLKKLVFFLVLILLSFGGFSQNCQISLKGLVLQKSNKESIPGAVVYLKGTKFYSQTTNQGNFSIQNICPGTYTIVCEISGYSKFEMGIDLKTNTSQTILLNEKIEELEEVTVHGHETEHTTQMSSHLTEQEKNERSGLNLGEMLKSVAGVQSLQTGSSISKPVIHGMHSSRVVILNQGVRQEGQQWGSEHAPEIDPFVSKNIQVIKGPAGLRYGGDAIGGIVMMEPDPLPDTVKLGGQIQTVYFTNGRQYVGSGYLEGTISSIKGLAWRVQGTLKNGGNINTANYYLANTGVREQNFSTEIGIKRKLWASNFYFSRFHTIIGIYAGSHIGNVGDLENAIEQTSPPAVFTPEEFTRDIDRPNQDVIHQMLKWKGQYKIGNNNYLRGNLAFQLNDRLELDVLRAGKNVNTLMFDLKTLSGELLYEETGMDSPWKGQFGLTFQNQSNLTSGPDIRTPTISNGLLPNYYLNSFGLFGIEKLIKPKYEIELGLRFDSKNFETHRVRVSNTRQFFQDFRNYYGISASIGGTYRWSKFFEQHLILAQAFRPPNASELFSNGIHHGAAAYEIGNPFLQGEQARNISLTSYYQDEKLEIELGLYTNFINNFIYLRPLIQQGIPIYFITVRGAFPGFQYEQINANFSGFDSKINVHFSPRWSVQQKIDIVNAKDTQNNQYLVNIPPYRYDISLKYTFPSDKQYVSLGLTRVDRQNRVEANSDYLTPPPGYQLVEINWGLNYKQFDFGVRVSNALNSAYRDYMNRFRYFADEQGRNISFRILYKLPNV